MTTHRTVSMVLDSNEETGIHAVSFTLEYRDGSDKGPCVCILKDEESACLLGNIMADVFRDYLSGLIAAGHITAVQNPGETEPVPVA